MYYIGVGGRVQVAVSVCAEKGATLLGAARVVWRETVCLPTLAPVPASACSCAPVSVPAHASASRC